MFKNIFINTMFIFLCFFLIAQLIYAQASELNEVQQKLVDTAYRFLNTFPIAYAYGGRHIGAKEDCDKCVQCLDDKTIVPSKQELIVCPICERCSIDCSHFVQLVFKSSGIYYPYLSTQMMIELNDYKLYETYGFINLKTNLILAKPGDLLVYKGHVVILTQLRKDQRGDIIHATRGHQISGIKGEGIQLERNVNLAYFRGRLFKILRHKSLIVKNILSKQGILKSTTNKDIKIMRTIENSN